MSTKAEILANGLKNTAEKLGFEPVNHLYGWALTHCGGKTEAALALSILLIELVAKSGTNWRPITLAIQVTKEKGAMDNAAMDLLDGMLEKATGMTLSQALNMPTLSLEDLRGEVTYDDMMRAMTNVLGKEVDTYAPSNGDEVDDSQAQTMKVLGRFRELTGAVMGQFSAPEILKKGVGLAMSNVAVSTDPVETYLGMVSGAYALMAAGAAVLGEVDLSRDDVSEETKTRMACIAIESAAMASKTGGRTVILNMTESAVSMACHCIQHALNRVLKGSENGSQDIGQYFWTQMAIIPGVAIRECSWFLGNGINPQDFKRVMLLVGELGGVSASELTKHVLEVIEQSTSDTPDDH